MRRFELKDMKTTLSASDRLILVIDADDDRAWKLKELIEFMDAPAVRVAAPDNWQSRIDGRGLAAVFVGNKLPNKELVRLIGDVGKLDPNVAIVIVSGEPHA
jgi:DNA-binding NtrC family response regulator